MAPADTLVCDTAQVAAWQSDPAFAYSRELIAPEINVLEWFSRWFGKLLDKIFGNTLVAEYSEVVLICIAVLIGAFALSADAETAQRWKTYRLAVI